ncbi:hypothetical protein COF09_31455 [Bacillus toyonensis]|nr:hypothetical protein COF09_31455 [Bacillus toyonensis]
MISIDEMWIDKQIENDISQFLWNYYSWESFTEFVVGSMEIVSILRQTEGRKSLAEAFLEDVVLDTYTIHTNQQGKQKVTNNRAGETQKVKKARPRYLNPIEWDH